MKILNYLHGYKQSQRDKIFMKFLHRKWSTPKRVWSRQASTYVIKTHTLNSKKN